jgi:hypothetical protein
MTILASTADYLVEYEAGMLTIARRYDGNCIGLTGRGIAGQFRDCLKTHGAERTIQTYIRMVPGATWQPLYKPGCVPQP